MDRPHEHIQATFWEECLSGTRARLDEIAFAATLKLSPAMRSRPCVPMDDLVASTNSVIADCKGHHPGPSRCGRQLQLVIAYTAGDGVVPTEGANEMVPAPAIDGVGPSEPTITSLASVPMIVPDPVLVAFMPRHLGQPRRQPSLVVTVRVGKAPRQRGVRTQNSLPSGSARTVHDTSPWPTSMSLAPRARSRATSAA